MDTTKATWQDVRESIRGALKTLAELDAKLNGKNPLADIFDGFTKGAHEK
jgi:hypothetical protein